MAAHDEPGPQGPDPGPDRDRDHQDADRELDGDGRPRRVLLVEDHHLLAQLIALQLNQEGIPADRATLGSHEDILATARHTPYTVVLLDLDLGDELGDSVPLIGALRHTGARVAMLTGVRDPQRLAECIEAGAVGVITKDRSFEHLMADLREVVLEGSLLMPGERDELLARLRRERQERERALAPFERLTRREQEVLAALMDGMSAQAIAADWVVSYETVRTQIRSVLAKLGVHSQLEAVAMARQAGWTGPHHGSPVST